MAFFAPVSRNILTLNKTRGRFLAGPGNGGFHTMSNVKKTRFLALSAVIAGLYAALTYAAAALNLAYGPIQFRFSEALTVLPFFLPAAVPGLFAGCILSNLLTGCLPLDVVFGSLATLLGALGTLFLGRSYRAATDSRTSRAPLWWTAPIPPIVANTLIVPFVLAYVYRFEGSIPYFMLTVGIGEILSCGVLGLLLFKLLERYRKYIFF